MHLHAFGQGEKAKDPREAQGEPREAHGSSRIPAELYQKSSTTALAGVGRAGVPGLEPRLTEPETVGLPITPYPNVIPP